MIYTSSLLRWLSLLDDLDDALITDMILSFAFFYGKFQGIFCLKVSFFLLISLIVF